MKKNILNKYLTGNVSRVTCASVVLLCVVMQPAHAIFIDPSIPITTELLSFGPDGINGDVFMPLTNAATTSTELGAPVATGDGYGWVKANIAITLSTTIPSTGQATLGKPTFFGEGAVPDGLGCSFGESSSGDVENGDTVCVDSFFNVFFDVTISDIDGTAGFFNGLGPASFGLNAQGPLFMEFQGECIADTSKVNFGCLPPEGSPYIGHFKIDAPLGVDVNGNGPLDFLHFVFGSHNVGGVTNTFVDGNQVIDEFGSTIAGTGSVDDIETDPPFVFTLTGPTTASQSPTFGPSVPEPSYLLLLSAGFGLMATYGRGQRKRHL